MPEVGHSVGITKGVPLDVGSTKQAKWIPRWHFVCSCGEQGNDTDARQAQADALSHAAGHVVRPVRVTKRATYHRGSKAPLSTGYGVD